jgi:hypothetical protein
MSNSLVISLGDDRHHHRNSQVNVRNLKREDQLWQIPSSCGTS